MSKGTNNCQQLNSNRKSAIKVGSLIDHKAYMTGSKRKPLHQYQVAASSNQKLIHQRGITGVKQSREKALKSSADYSALIQKALWFEAR